MKIPWNFEIQLKFSIFEIQKTCNSVFLNKSGLADDVVTKMSVSRILNDRTYFRISKILKDNNRLQIARKPKE